MSHFFKKIHLVYTNNLIVIQFGFIGIMVYFEYIYINLNNVGDYVNTL